MPNIEAAELVLPGAPLAATVAFLTERLGFRVEAIFPADAPSVAVVVGHGVRVRLERDVTGDAGTLRLRCADPARVAGGKTEFAAPNGMRVQLVPADPPLALPPVAPAFEVTHLADTPWTTGRAGMQYRDLLPGRQGGRFIASHIRIPGGGPVPDYAHYHKVRFQMIYCYRGWVRVVYEDQGPPFELRAGDCVLQPPGIRHRVLESSDALEVIEIGCPAEHQTFADLSLELPTPLSRRGRDFGGQRFVRHEANAAVWTRWRRAGFECRDTGIGEATRGLAGVQVVRPRGHAPGSPRPHVDPAAELVFGFVLSGTATLAMTDGSHALAAGDCFAVPATTPYALTDCSGKLEVLDVTLPAASA